MIGHCESSFLSEKELYDVWVTCDIDNNVYVKLIVVHKYGSIIPVKLRGQIPPGITLDLIL